MRRWPDIWMLVEDAVADAPLASSPDHGRRHWWEVARLGLQLARADHRVRPLTVIMFALFHDARRMSEHDDPAHGRRGADALREAFNDELPEFGDLAVVACETHDLGEVERRDPTIAACHDADRLLLPRVGITVDPNLLATDAARDHVAGTRRLLMPEADEPLAWGQLWIIASRLTASRQAG